MNKATRLAKLIGKPKRRLIGLMSGMSMDGVDLAYAEISGAFPQLAVNLLSCFYRPYPKHFRECLLAAQQGSLADASRLNMLVAEEFAKTTMAFLAKEGIDRAEVDAIGSHGQTLFHSTSSLGDTPSTLQVGSPSLIAERTGILTIGNFRPRDIAAGGQGAPLVALADFLLFREPGADLALNNLGSISNVTVVTSDPSRMLSFDTGPANLAIDYFARRAPGNHRGIDASGELSARGRCVPELLQKLLDNPFFRLPAPKAAGYDEFGASFLASAARDFTNFPAEHLVRTAVEWAAVTIAGAYQELVLPKFPKLKKVIFSGGGVHNHTLMARIRELLPTLKVEILPTPLADAKEALAFAILANELLSGRAGSLPSITGVRKPTLLGEIAL